MIIILSPLKQFDIIAWMLCQHFNDKNTLAKVVTNYTDEVGLYIILGHQYLKTRISQPYIIYQWEPWDSSIFHKNSHLLEDAKEVWDYSRCNLKQYKKCFLLQVL